jgi:dihydrofolate synthase/folylpolyglutamate synthase
MNRNGSSLADWLVRLESFSPHEIDLGLDRVQAVLDRLQPTLPRRIFHITGTNGKGSSVAFAAALLALSNERIGSYTSPHISRFNERITVDSSAASDDEIIAAFERVEVARAAIPLTYFEFGTIAALLVFESRKVECALLEIGLGGRLDAVNAIEPTAGLITNVALDHCAWLGEDVESIGFEKAGIMRAGKSTVYADESVPRSVLEHARAIGADLVLAGRDYRWNREASGWNWHGRGHTLTKLEVPSLDGEFQVGNAAGVLALLETAGYDRLLEVDVVNRAFTGTRLAGRLQSVNDGHSWLLDVAHNAAASGVLAEALAADPIEGQTVAIVGMLDDKNVAGLVAPLQDHVDSWIAVSALSARAIDAAELGRQIANQTNAPCLVADDLPAAMDEARDRAGTAGRLLVCGSFHIVGPALEALGIYSQRKGDS